MGVVKLLAEYNTTLAWRCPICGELSPDEINIFDFSGNNKLDLKCDCDFVKVSIDRMKNKYCLEYTCIFCESRHSILYSPEEFWNNQIKQIKCLDMGAELGYLGPQDKINSFLETEEELNHILSELEVKDYFYQPEIMLSILDELQSIAESSNLVCQCGNLDIDIEILPQELRLICENCQGTTTINTETQEDLQVLKKMQKVKILEGVVSALEGASKQG